MPETSDGATISQSDALHAWQQAARDGLIATAGTYGGLITYKELAELVQEETGITTRQRLNFWIGDLLELVSQDADRRGDPRLTSLCVMTTDQTIGAGYPWAKHAVDEAERENIAAQDRLECYRRYAVDLPNDGGVPLLTPLYEKRQERERRRAIAKVDNSAFPTSWLVASNSGMFKSDAAFAARDQIDWSETTSAGIKLGGTAPISGLTHECLVVQTGIPFENTIDDREFWADEQAFTERSARTWMRLKRLRTFSDVERTQLSLKVMLDHGLRAAPQGRMRAPEELEALIESLLGNGGATDDSAAENSPADDGQMAQFRTAITEQDFAVPDQFVTSKTRGSAQRVFADEVKRNYGYQCAVTGVRTRAFLVASHIVPWADDSKIRLDPSNGICLSTLVDRAFDTGYLSITPEVKVIVNVDRLQGDSALQAMLSPLDGVQLQTPKAAAPRPRYLERRIDSDKKRFELI